MNIAFYNGVSGLVTFQNEMDILSHNIANVNTNGYKAFRGMFKELLYNEMYVNPDDGGQAAAEAAQAGQEEYEEPFGSRHLNGHGVRLEQANLVFRQGNLVSTEQNLDLALVGEGCFAVGRRGGTVQYTRNGAFDIGLEGEKNGYLVTFDGSFVLDAKGARIKLDREPNGMFNTKNLTEKVGVYVFPNPYGVESVGENNYRETELSGIPEAPDKDKPYRIVSGALERSSTDLAEEMTNVIVTQKAFSFSAKMVQTADELEQTVNSLR